MQNTVFVNKNTVIQQTIGKHILYSPNSRENWIFENEKRVGEEKGAHNVKFFAEYFTFIPNWLINTQKRKIKTKELRQ